MRVPCGVFSALRYRTVWMMHANNMNAPLMTNRTGTTGAGLCVWMCMFDASLEIHTCVRA